MPTDTDKNAELEKVLKNVINVLQDGQKGFADLGEHLKDDTLKRYFLAESLKRANFRAELENELHRHGVKDVHEEGTALGTLHRTWGDLKAKIATPDDHSLLATAEQAKTRPKPPIRMPSSRSFRSPFASFSPSSRPTSSTLTIMCVTIATHSRPSN